MTGTKSVRCCPSRASRLASRPVAAARNPVHYNKRLDRKGRKIENLFPRLKDWRRIATRYDRCAHAFRSAILLAATVLFCYES